MPRYALNVVSPVGQSAEDRGDDKGHSGRLLLRMPRTLHAELAQAAEKRGVSLNQLIVGLLSSSLTNGASAPGQGAGGRADAVVGTERRLGVALAVNLVVLVVAGAIAIALLVVAWHDGF
jgi:HicB family